jgi:hypothetical protein
MGLTSFGVRGTQVCDTLHSVLLESLRELLGSTRPKRPLLVYFEVGPWPG